MQPHDIFPTDDSSKSSAVLSNSPKTHIINTTHDEGHNPARHCAPCRVSSGLVPHRLQFKRLRQRDRRVRERIRRRQLHLLLIRTDGSQRRFRGQQLLVPVPVRGRRVQRGDKVLGYGGNGLPGGRLGELLVCDSFSRVPLLSNDHVDR